jgi:hypothetical protein
MDFLLTFLDVLFFEFYSYVCKTFKNKYFQISSVDSILNIPYCSSGVWRHN